jgi:hypothetical protein
VDSMSFRMAALLLWSFVSYTRRTNGTGRNRTRRYEVSRRSKRRRYEARSAVLRESSIARS